MEKGSRLQEGWTVGLDVSDRFTQVCAVGASGEVQFEDRVATVPEAVERFFAGGLHLRIVLEAGTHSAWMSRLLGELGHEVVVANPRKLRLIYGSDQKNDRRDAEHLARLGRMDVKLLSPLRHRSQQTQAHLSVLRAREALVAARTQMVCHVRSQLKVAGVRLAACSTAAVPKRARQVLPEDLVPALEPLLETIEELTGQIRGFNATARHLCEKHYPQTQILRQVPGVGPLTALCFVLTIEDPGKFKKSREVGPYLGLVPRKDDSGERTSQLGITKAGDTHLRRLLVQAAHYVLGHFGPDTDLRRYGLKLAERGGPRAKKKALVAVARKLAVLLHHLWVTGEVYEPLRHEAQAA